RAILDKLQLHPASLESYPSLYKVLMHVQPDEVYHLAAQSFVSYSFEDEFSTINTNINGTHHVLSCVREVSPHARFYFAGSSEMFGEAPGSPQNEETQFHPRSAYGISKVAGYQLTRNSRGATNFMPPGEFSSITGVRGGETYFGTGTFSSTLPAATF